MPKVSDAYMQGKRERILDAAMEVFEKKPLFSVTMMDIITRSGLSQGGIYRYFEDIDEIIAAAHNRAFEEIDYDSGISELLKKELPPEQIIREAFSLLAKSAEASAGTFRKMRFELLMLYSASPKRAAKIQSRLKVGDSNRHMMDAAMEFITLKVQAGGFKPLLPLGELYSFVAVSCDGILFSSMLDRSIEGLKIPPGLIRDVHVLFDTLARTVITMLGGSAL